MSIGKILLGVLGVWWLSHAPASAATLVAEVEPNNTFATAQVIGVHDGSIDIIGAINPDGDLDYFTFQGSAGNTVTLQTFDLGADTFFDTILTLFDSVGNQVAFNDDCLCGDGFASAITYTLLTSAPYTVSVRGFFQSDRFAYRVELRGLTPSAVPIPAALPLLASGLGALGFIGWRRKRKAAQQAA